MTTELDELERPSLLRISNRLADIEMLGSAVVQPLTPDEAREAGWWLLRLQAVADAARDILAGPLTVTGAREYDERLFRKRDVLRAALAALGEEPRPSGSTGEAQG